jgi:D-glycero-alpha-D-manno-heptose-7-phosphate kinase
MHTPHDHIKVSYSKQECVTNVDDLQNEIVKNALKFFGIKSNIEITSFADIPTIGTGLGGSSAFTCALVKALSAYLGCEYKNPYGIAKTSCHIEIDLCGWNIGMQDQFASAFGGMNYIKYSGDRGEPRTHVERMDSNAIENYMILIPTNIERHSAKILDNINFETKTFNIKELSHMADLIKQRVPEPDTYGTMLNTAWDLKKQLNGDISNSDIDNMYDRCCEARALGAKLLGAGGGGYMLALTKSKNKIREAFKDRTCLDVGISHEGARIVYTDE